MTDRDPSITTFYGPDGCGKSTVVKALHSVVDQPRRPFIILGGSSYRQWLTPKVARETLGSSSIIDHATATPEETTRLYEDIAVACYGLAHHLREGGTSVLIDSDPYLKRIIWGSVAAGNDGASSYINSFNDRFNRSLELAATPDTIVGINMDSTHLSASGLLKRLRTRGNNTYNDPETLEEMAQLITAVAAVWREVELASATGSSQYAGLNARLAGKRVRHIKNPDVPDELRTNHLKNLVADIQNLAL